MTDNFEKLQHVLIVIGLALIAFSPVWAPFIIEEVLVR
jgi:hypothetical protein